MARFKLHLGVALVLSIAASAGVARAGDLPSVAEPATPETHQPQMVEARKQFQAGVNLLDDPDGAKYEEAYSAFKKAYELSQSSKVLGNVGFCAMHLERDGEAIDAYTRYLAETLDVPERERAQIQKDLATMSSTVARLRVVVKGHGAARPATPLVLVDTRTQTRGPAIENTYAFTGEELTIRLRPGRHTLKVKADGEESLPIDAAIEPASQVAHEARFAPPKTIEPAPAPVLLRPSPSLAGPILLGVTGVLALGGGTAMGLVARSKTSAIQSRCPDDLCPQSYDLASARSEARTFGTVADVGLISGGALLGGALLWYVLLPKGGPVNPAAANPTRWRSAAMCTGDGCNMQLGKGF